MLRSKNARRATVGMLLALTTSAASQQADVTFFVIGKHANYAQQADGGLAPVDFSFFSEIFLTADGNAERAELQVPGSTAVSYRDMRNADGGSRDNLLLVTGNERYTSFADLQTDYPDGDYQVDFLTASGTVNATLTFQERPLPAPPMIDVQQGGKRCGALRPGIDAQVSWRAFAEGRADANGILDDLIFVILDNASGERIAHSGRPFENRPFLTYADERFVIDGGVLLPDETYTLSVEHALLDDTTEFNGVPAFTTRAVTTRLPIRTTSSGQADCVPATPPLTEQITMLYYEDIAAAAHFYGEVLGLKKTFDWDWVRFYTTGPSSSVGVVREGEGAWHETQASNAVMLSLVTSDVDTWYAKVKDREEAVVLKELGNGGGIRSFMLEDPGGYTVEFFEWLPADDAQP